jgi:cyclopropane fatty-acyl-phospholipid synthase-like methyltransferase
VTDQRLANYTRRYFLGRDIPEVANYAEFRIREDQLACLHYALLGPDGALRRPGLVLDVGAGRGELSAAFAICGVPVIGVEPSRAGATLYRQTMRRWARTEPRLIDRIDDCAERPDTVIFCESLEHIPEDEFAAMWPRIVDWLTPGGRLIVANWIWNHPIPEDGSGWDHVRPVDDALYDRLAEGRTLVFRTGSHLVIDF